VVAARATPLAPYEWRYRPVLVFTPSVEDGRMKDQAKRLRAAASALKERDMVVVTIAGSQTVMAEQAAPPSADAAALRRAFNVERDAFTVVLVGKDGTEKYRAGGVVDPADLMVTVDGMPMRRDEARTKTGASRPAAR